MKPLKPFTWIVCLFTSAALNCQAQPSADDKDAILPGRHLSEHQVADIASHELPQTSGFQCHFKDGVWEIYEIQKGVWGVYSAITNADGKVAITSTNATRLVLRVKDADGTAEHVQTPEAFSTKDGFTTYIGAVKVNGTNVPLSNLQIH